MMSNGHPFFLFIFIISSQVCVCEEIQKEAKESNFDDKNSQSSSEETKYCHRTSCATSNNPSADMALVPYDEANVPLIYRPQRQFTFLGHTLSIAQNWGKHGVAAVVWDAAVVLCEYLTQHPGIVKGQQVLELGAGTGLVGMVAALAGGDVTITERAEALEHLKEAVSTNLSPVSHRFHVAELDWTHDHTHWSGNFNVILGADIIYIEETFSDLLRTLLDFMGPDTKVLLSCKIRYERDKKFLSLLQIHVQISEIYFDSKRDIRIYLAKKIS